MGFHSIDFTAFCHLVLLPSLVLNWYYQVKEVLLHYFLMLPNRCPNEFKGSTNLMTVNAEAEASDKISGA